MRPIDVSAGLLFRNGKLLITQRLADAHLGGLWEFPGGKREGEETFEHCLLRELEEELGIRVHVGPLIESITHEYPEKIVRLHFYRCTLESGEPTPLACADCRWVSHDELADYAFPAADAALLRRLCSNDEIWK
jgi:8-oxo-dGTP diphosphatase